MTSRNLGVSCSAFPALLLSLSCLSGCKIGKGHAEVDGVLIAQADAFQERPKDDGDLLLIRDGISEQPVLPENSHITLAIGRDVPWAFVSTLLNRLDKAGKQTTILVGNKHRVHAMVLDDKLKTALPMEVTATEDGKACVQLPRAPAAKCSQSIDARHVNRMGVRQTVREASKAINLYDVKVFAAPGLGWADVVRTVDGARTCCGEGTTRVAIHRGKSEKKADEDSHSEPSGLTRADGTSEE